MALVACAFLCLQGRQAETVLRSGFAHFSEIVVLFTAVAIPAHMIERSGGFKAVACRLGQHIGGVCFRLPRLAVPLLVFELLLLTCLLASLMHNVTSILIMTPIIIHICKSYRVFPLWLLSAALVASNIGGFSTRWGDTPNIVESRVWGLSAVDFAVEVLPANLIVFSVLTSIAAFLTNWATKRQETKDAGEVDPLTPAKRLARAIAAFEGELQDLWVDYRLLAAGMGSLIGFILLQFVYPEHQIAIGAATILISILLDRPEDRLGTLKSLGYDVYIVLGSIFVLAGCVEHSWIGATLQYMIARAGAAPWSIAITGYLGTMFTEAASWASAASAHIFPLDSTHSAAWALGAGICAGSSSIVTAASAGIVLCEESRRSRSSTYTMTFRRYLAFGLPFSVLMLVFYAAYFTFIRF